MCNLSNALTVNNLFRPVVVVIVSLLRRLPTDFTVLGVFVVLPSKGREEIGDAGGVAGRTRCPAMTAPGLVAGGGA